MINLTKSIDSAKDVEDGKAERRLIWGEITNPNPDEDDERLISKSLDFSYFDDQGWIKYEHVRNDPAHIIGCPHERATTKEGGTLIKGALFPDGKFSNDVWQLIQNIEAHNRQFPKNQKTLGWSIEGHYTDSKVAKGGFRKAKVVNVVITPNPVNKSVYLHKLEENHRLFAKSLNYGDEVEKAMTATPTSTDLAAKTGVDAIAKENVDEKIKETAEELESSKGSEDDKPRKKKKLNKSTIGSHEMKTFENVEAAQAHFIEQGEDEESAAKLAKSMFPEEETDGSTETSGDTSDTGDGGDNETTSLLKGLGQTLGEIKDRMFKSTETANTDDLGAADEFETITDDNGEEFIDAAPMLVDMGKSVEGLTNLLNQKVAYDHERDQEMAKALGEVAVMRDTLSAAIGDLQKAVVIGEGEKAVPIGVAIQAMLKSRTGAPINLDNLQVAGEGGGDGNTQSGLPEGFPKTFGELQKSLVVGHSAEKISTSEMSLAENAFRSREFDTVQTILEKANVKTD